MSRQTIALVFVVFVAVAGVAILSRESRDARLERIAAKTTDATRGQTTSETAASIDVASLARVRTLSIDGEEWTKRPTAIPSKAGELQVEGVLEAVDRLFSERVVPSGYADKQRLNVSVEVLISRGGDDGEALDVAQILRDAEDDGRRMKFHGRVVMPEVEGSYSLSFYLRDWSNRDISPSGLETAVWYGPFAVVAVELEPGGG